MYRKQCAVHGLVMCTADENAANVCAGVRDFRFRRGESQRPAPDGRWDSPLRKRKRLRMERNLRYRVGKV